MNPSLNMGASGQIRTSSPGDFRTAIGTGDFHRDGSNSKASWGNGAQCCMISSSQIEFIIGWSSSSRLYQAHYNNAFYSD